MFNKAVSCQSDDFIRSNNYLTQCLKHRGCQKCPDYGFCDENGKLASCTTSYKKKGNFCVKDEKIELAADQVLNDIQMTLQVANGINMVNGKKREGFEIEHILNLTYASLNGSNL